MMLDMNSRETIWVAADEEEMAGVQRKHSTTRQRGCPCHNARFARLCDIWKPNLRDGLAGGLLVPEDAG